VSVIPAPLYVGCRVRASRGVMRVLRDHPYMPRLRNRRVLDAAVRCALDVPVWDANGFAFAERYDEASVRYWVSRRSPTR
jgi:hypothetical protein